MVVLLLLLVLAVGQIQCGSNPEWNVLSDIRNPRDGVLSDQKDAVPVGTRGAAMWCFNNDEEDEAIYVFGGKTAQDARTNDFWKYEEVSNRWWLLSSSNNDNGPSARTGAAYWKDVEGRFWIYGGRADDSQSIVDSLWYYDRTSMSWTAVESTTDGPGSRFGTIHWYSPGENTLYIAGGEAFSLSSNDDNEKRQSFDDFWQFNLQTLEWSPVGVDPLPFGPIDDASVAYDAKRGVAYVFGGETPGQDNSVRGEFWSFDNDNGWIQLSSEPPARKDHVSWFIVKEKRVCIFGGRDAMDRPLDDMWCYSVSDGKWTEEHKFGAITGRRGAVACIDDQDDESVYLFGGVAGTSTYFNDVWKYGSYIGRRDIIEFLNSEFTVNTASVVAAVSSTIVLFIVLVDRMVKLCVRCRHKSDYDYYKTDVKEQHVEL